MLTKSLHSSDNFQIMKHMNHKSADDVEVES